MATYNNETVDVEPISSLAVNINDGMKIIVYINKSMCNRIVEQVKKNNGQLDHTTAMAIASSVAASVKYLSDENWKELRSNPHKPSDSSYDFEEDDDPRTIFNPDDED